VRTGDTLSSIAQRFYHSAAYWPVLYWANHGQIRYANDVQAGQVLTIPVRPVTVPAPPSALAPAAPAPVATGAAATGATAIAYDATAGSQTAGSQAATGSQAAAGQGTQSAPASDSGAQAGGGSSFRQCVISRESGGNSQARGAGGYYGLYQFSASTWAEYGGNPADFGNASVAEQNQVFDNAIAAGGQSNWSSYDGC
jgi:phage tail protein X